MCMIRVLCVKNHTPHTHKLIFLAYLVQCYGIWSCLSHKWFVMCAISIYYYHKQQHHHSTKTFRYERKTEIEKEPKRRNKQIFNTRHKSSLSLTHILACAHTHAWMPWKGQQKGWKQRQQPKQENYGTLLKGLVEIFWSLPLLLLRLLLLHNYTQYIFVRKRGINNGRHRKWWVNYVVINRHLIANIDFNRPITNEHAFFFSIVVHFQQQQKKPMSFHSIPFVAITSFSCSFVCSCHFVAQFLLEWLGSVISI